jgi:hypothetical protein
MAAIASFYIHSTSTVDAQIGLNADPTAMLTESLSSTHEREEIVHQNFAAHETVFIDRTPKMTFNFSCMVLARTVGLTNSHPGTAVSRATISQLRAGTNHGFDITEGWWKFGNVTHEQPRGDLDKINFPVKIVGFPVSSTGTLVSSNPP